MYELQTELMAISVRYDTLTHLIVMRLNNGANGAIFSFPTIAQGLSHAALKGSAMV
ncbi:hypothetical protein [Nodosilinea sp. E11]|uniref:hypothetical protein n=1 Tax=Nodosilinea sp. E11 TaxID=3037479 RepID=UPI002934973B|nr:hypothetical protein [Nodosilinea sp. E11]WOD37774.1 hypothetical protein RRF56_16305 [Nodosilinea sp. E11]